MSLPPPLPPPDDADEGKLSSSGVLLAAHLDEAGEVSEEELPGVDELLEGVSPALRSAARREALRAVRGALGSTLFTVVENGWQLHSELVDSANRTLETAGATETVEVADHRIEASYTPKVDVFLDGARMGSIEFALTVSARVALVIAVITEGRLVSLRSGYVEFGAHLLAEGHEIANGSRRADLVAEMPLGGGIQLAHR